MKHFFLVGAALVPALLFAQEDYKVKGKVGNFNAPTKIFLQYNNDGEQRSDSTNIVNGEFEFSGTVSEAQRAYLILSPEGKSIDELEQQTTDYTSLYLANGEVSVQGPSLNEAKITGNKINDELASYNTLSKEINDGMMALNKEYTEAPAEKKQDEEYINSLQSRAEELSVKQEKIDNDFMTNNPNSYVSISLALRKISAETLPEIETYYATLNDEMKNSTTGKNLASRIEALSSLKIGATAPDFTLSDTSGNPVALSSLRGKYVLIDFWASWCGPCRHENPTVVAAYNKYKEKGFTVFGVSLDFPGKKEDWMKAISDDQLSQWQHVSDLQGWESSVVPIYAINSIPQNFLLDKEGKIVASNLRGEALEEKLAEILN